MNVKESITVKGMSCSHCVASVKKAVGALKGVKSVEVDLESQIADVDFDSELIDLKKIREAIEEQGYDVE